MSIEEITKELIEIRKDMMRPKRIPTDWITYNRLDALLHELGFDCGDE